jgi:hypothetical protein
MDAPVSSAASSPVIHSVTPSAPGIKAGLHPRDAVVEGPQDAALDQLDNALGAQVEPPGTCSTVRYSSSYIRP